MTKKFSIDQEKFVIDTYFTCQNLNETSRKCGFLSNTSVANILFRNNIQHISLIPKYDKNINFFDKIDNEAKAYFLGFLLADGNNYTKRKCNYQISITLQEKDKYILELLRDLIIPNKKLHFIPKPKESHQNYYRLKFDSKIISQQLEKLECISVKSLTLLFPECMTHSPFLNHFIRGYSDGNGTISMWIKKLKTTTNNNYVWKLTSSDKFCSVAKHIIDELCNVKMHSKLAQAGSENNITTTIEIGGNRQVLRVLNWLYSDATIYLHRKYDKYVELKNNY